MQLINSKNVWIICLYNWLGIQEGRKADLHYICSTCLSLEFAFQGKAFWLASFSIRAECASSVSILMICWHRDPLYPCFSHPAHLLNSLNSALLGCLPGLLDLFSDTCVIIFVSTWFLLQFLCSSDFLRMGCLLFCRLYRFQRMPMPWYRMTLSFSSYIWKSEIKCLNSLFDGVLKFVHRRTNNPRTPFISCLHWWKVTCTHPSLYLTNQSST